MLYNLSELLLLDGTEKEINSKLELISVNFQGVTYALKNPGRIELKLMNLGKRRIQVEGSFEVTLLIPCDRCTEEVPYRMHECFVKDFDLNVTTDDDSDDQDDMKYISDENLDINQLIYDEIILHFPMKILCKEDCKGLCKKCGCDLNKDKCKCDNIDIDPRMAVFQDIMKRF
jgi:uncharacterized protein